MSDRIHVVINSIKETSLQHDLNISCGLGLNKSGNDAIKMLDAINKSGNDPVKMFSFWQFAVQRHYGACLHNFQARVEKGAGKLQI